MRKLFMFNMVTLNGFFEGTNNEIDWHNVDDEFNEFAIEQMKTVDLLLFGRKTYELMAGYWSTETAKGDDPVVAERMNSISKIVFSTTMQKAEWKNTRLIKANLKGEILKLKGQNGGEIAIFGSSNLASSLIKKNLIDELRLMVNPVLLGKGKPLFSGIESKMNVKLAKTRIFKSGNVLLSYTPL